MTSGKKTARSFSRKTFRETRPQKKETLPNSLVSRIMEEDGAEYEAYRLSRGVSSTTPDELREEMGSRLGTDFSSVRFHSDAMSADRSQALGARAWTRGRDVYFGKGGFDPRIAAHELVHTVQQGAVHGNVSESMPMGAVQLWPNEDEEDDINTDSIKDAKKAKVDPLESTLLTLFSTEYGQRCYRDIEKKLKEMIQKGAGKPIRNYSPESAIHFLVEGATRVHAGKEILQEIAEKPLESKSDAKERASEYNYLFKFLTTGLGEFGIEEIAVENEMNSRPAKYQHTRSTKDTRTKRAWELDDHSKDKDEQMVFNPTKDPELEDVQRKIDAARDAKAAYSIFATFAGNAKGAFKDETGTAKNLDVNMLKKKLKHMARVVVDYPELRGNIGNMKTKSKTKKVLNQKTGKMENTENSDLMGTSGTLGYRHKADFEYNAWMDRKGAEDERAHMDWKSQYKNLLNAHRDYAGTHELGHVLASTLLDPENRSQAVDENIFMQPESKMLQRAASEAYLHHGLPYELAGVKTKEIYSKTKSYTLANPKASGFYENNQTSKYGASNPSEFFAEAVSDVYAHGNKAKTMSIEIVKQYEKNRTDATKKNFFHQQKNQPGILKKLFGWLKFW